jgi:hypothetical protein
MYTYEFVADNPEGIDYILEFVHKFEFRQEQFERICNHILVRYYNYKLRNSNKRRYIASTPEPDEISIFFEKMGFEGAPNNITASFNYEPYWNKKTNKLKDVFKEVEDHNKHLDLSYDIN